MEEHEPKGERSLYSDIQWRIQLNFDIRLRSGQLLNDG